MSLDNNSARKNQSCAPKTRPHVLIVERWALPLAGQRGFGEATVDK